MLGIVGMASEYNTNLTYLRAYRNVRHSGIFSQCGKCLRERATTKENLGYHFVLLAKYFVVPYISVCPQVLYVNMYDSTTYKHPTPYTSIRAMHPFTQNNTSQTPKPQTPNI